MDRIRPTQTSALIEALRKLSRSKAGATDAGAAASEALPANLRDELRELAAGVDIDHDESLRAIQPQILRCILRHEWGQGVDGDPAFAGIVNSVNEAICRTPRLQAVLREALQALR